MPNRLTAIRKPGGAHNTHEHITDVKFVADGTALTVQRSVADVISDIKRNISYYVSRGGRSIAVTIGTRNGREHIKTEPDSTLADNLLSLPLF